MSSTQMQNDGNVPSHITNLDNFMRLLSRLKRHEGQSVASEEVWTDAPMRASGRRTSKQTPPIQTSDLCDLRQSLDEAKLYLVTMNEVRELLGKRIRSLRRACIPLVLENGIKTLPDEILSQVFEAGHLSTGGYTFAKRVSHVSHRFRHVALQTPLIWTRISGSYSERQVQLFASRSGQMGLDISMDRVGFSDSKFMSLLLALRPYSDRWSHLHMYHESVGLAMQQMGLTDLPRLQVLYPHCDINMSSWNLPLLSRVCSKSFNFSPLSNIRQQLTSFELVVDGSCGTLDIASLAQGIYAMQNLKGLSITVKEYRGTLVYPDEWIGRTPGRHSFPIDTLEVAIQDRLKTLVIEPFYNALSFLRPSTVNVTLEGPLDTESDLPKKSCLAGTEGVFPYGTRINIRVLATDIPHPNRRTYGLLTTLLRECDIAHTINIEARMASFLSPWANPWTDLKYDWKFFTPLRYLRFTRCDYLTELELHALATNLIIRAGPETGLQRLEVLDCRGISEEFLLDLSDKVGSTLIWER